MAVSKKGSRKIVVDDTEFRWRATGNDDWISVVIWPVENDDSRIVASIGYHHDMVKIGDGHWASEGQIVVTNRIIREVVLHVGIQKLLGGHSQINIGAIEDIFDVKNGVRS